MGARLAMCDRRVALRRCARPTGSADFYCSHAFPDQQFTPVPGVVPAAQSLGRTGTHVHTSLKDGPRTNMLEVRQLVKRYNRIPAVDGVSFTIRPGEILGYVGPNGAGKSTTVKVLTGLIEPTSGEILFQGRDVRADWVGFQRRMGYVPEEPHLYPHLAGREYLQLVGRL